MSVRSINSISCVFSAAPTPLPSAGPGTRLARTEIDQSKRPNKGHDKYLAVPVLTGRFESVSILCRDRHLVQVPVPQKTARNIFIIR
jgi:hypothetical protein